MTAIEAIILNFEEIRGRSIKIWSGLTPEFYHWKPDVKAQSCIEMIRHVLEVENIYRLLIINKGGNVSDFDSPWKDQPLTDLQNELEFAAPYRKEFLKTIQLQFEFGNGKEDIVLPFYESKIDSIYDLPALERKIENWEMILSKINGIKNKKTITEKRELQLAD